MRVVSITSMAVERDSRTFKFAASIARFGHESVVVEGEPSKTLGDDLPFTMLSPEEGPAAQSPPPPAAPPSGSRVAGVVRSATGPARNALFILRFNLDDMRGRSRQAADLLPEADVYWLHSFFQFPAVYRAARRHKARFLYDTPDAYWEPGQSPAEGRPLKFVMRSYERMERFSVRRAEAFTTVSGGVAGLMEKRFGRRPQVVRNLHDLRLDTDPPRGIREVTGVGEDDFLLVMTGNLKGGMAVREAVTAMRDVPDHVHLAFVGRGHGASAGLVEELGFEGRVHLLDPVPPTQIVRFIAGADASPILYLPSSANYIHSLPNGFFHAIAAGLPVLYPALPEIAALATEHRLGVEIDPGDPAAMAATISELASDEAATAAHRASVERAREVLNWEREESLLADILAGG